VPICPPSTSSRTASATRGCRCASSGKGAPIPEDAGLRLAVFRIVQESLTNTLRHAIDATEARVTVRHEPGRIEIEVDDDGRPASHPHVPGHGLVGMQQRAAAHGGRARSGPGPSGGWRTRVTLLVPLDGAPDD